MGLFEQARRGGYGLATVYLPGCDISRQDPGARRTAVAALEARLAEWVGSAERGETVLVVLAADSHAAA